MSKAAFTVRAFAVYLLLLGVALVFVPNLLLTMFMFPPTNEVWIRVLGIVVINIGVYYWYGAQSESRPLLWATVGTRLFALLAFALLVAAGLAKPMLVLFGGVDTLGALWTLMALRSERTAG